MKNKINFESLQRFDKVDANDLQENIYSQVEDLTQGMFRSGVHGIASTATKLDNAKRNGMHGPLIPIPSVAIDQANSLLTITDDFAVVERNSGDVITFDATDRAAGYNVISTTSVQAFVDSDTSAYRQNDVEGGGYTSLAIFAYPVTDTKVESRQFYNVGTGTSAANNTTTRNRTRLNLFVDIYERTKNVADANGNYPTLIGKWEFGRIESNMRTLSGGVYTLNPVIQWPSSAGWISNVVWNWVLPDSLNVVDTTTHPDRSLANASKLPNTITEPGPLRVADGGSSTHDMRLMFKHIQRLIDRIQVAGVNDPTSTDLGTVADTNQTVDAYGVLDGATKTVNNSLHAELPPYSLRGLKRFIDVNEHNSPLSASIDVMFTRYDTSGYTDGISRTTVKAVQSGPAGEFGLGALFDFYDVYTNALGVAAPSSTDAVMAVGDALASANTGILETASGAATNSALNLAHLYRNMIISIPSAYAGYNICDISLTPIYRYTAGASTFFLNNGLSTNHLHAAIITDDDNVLEGNDSGFSTSRNQTQTLTQVNTIAFTDNQGNKSSINGVRLMLGSNATLVSALTNSSTKSFGLKISVTLRNNSILSAT